MDLEQFVQSEERAVSPVIAVVLMIGVTVVLAGGALAGGAQFLDGFGENPSAQVQFDVNSSGDVEVLVNSVNDDVNELSVTVNDESAGWADDPVNASTGSYGVITEDADGNDLSAGDRIIVTAETDNNDATVAEFTYPE